MLEKLVLKNVGPAPEMSLEFAPRVNIITGDNGLGKSFILDIAWWALTSRESVRIVPKNLLVAAEIKATLRFDHQPKFIETTAKFNRKQQIWDLNTSADSFENSIIIYMNVNNRFLIREPYRSQNFVQLNAGAEPDFFDFDMEKIWEGFEKAKKPIINGLIRDWGFWQIQNNEEFLILQTVLEILSPNEKEKIKVGSLKRTDLSDARDIPSIQMPYGDEVSILHISSALKRIISLAYVLVWSRREHQRASDVFGVLPSNEMVLLIDEVEQHLHPTWQRSILESVLKAVETILDDSEVKIQIIATTHSPLVMASLEPIFDTKQDAWFDLNLVNGTVQLEKMPWSRRGGAENWLISEAFDLHSTGSKPREVMVEEASRIFDVVKPSKKKFLELDKKLRAVLSDTDEFWDNWRFLGRKKGWL